MATVRDFAADAKRAIQVEIDADVKRYVANNPVDAHSRCRDQGVMKGLKKALELIDETLKRSDEDPEDTDA